MIVKAFLFFLVVQDLVARMGRKLESKVGLAGWSAIFLAFYNYPLLHDKVSVQKPQRVAAIRCWLAIHVCFYLHRTDSAESDVGSPTSVKCISQKFQFPTRQPMGVISPHC